MLVDALAVRLVVVGEDFHFGHKRSGNVALLRRLGAEYDFEVQPIHLLERTDGVDEPVSSTAVRRRWPVATWSWRRRCSDACSRPAARS